MEIFPISIKTLEFILEIPGTVGTYRIVTKTRKSGKSRNFIGNLATLSEFPDFPYWNSQISYFAKEIAEFYLSYWYNLVSKTKERKGWTNENWINIPPIINNVFERTQTINNNEDLTKVLNLVKEKKEKLEFINVDKIT